MLREDRHAVVGLLADDGEVVAEILDLQPREGIVGGLDLLQQDDIGLRWRAAKSAHSAMCALIELTFQLAMRTKAARDQSEKELPQPQEEVAFGLRT